MFIYCIQYTVDNFEQPFLAKNFWITDVMMDGIFIKMKLRAKKIAIISLIGLSHTRLRNRNARRDSKMKFEKFYDITKFGIDFSHVDFFTGRSEINIFLNRVTEYFINCGFD